MKNQKIYDKWTKFINDPTYSKYFLSNEESWFVNLDEIKSYIKQNFKRPSNNEKDVKIKKLAMWIGTQQKNYIKQTGIMKNQDIYDKWTEFITSETYSKCFTTGEKAWYIKLNEVKSYIDKNQKLPIKRDKDSNIKLLGIWISTQKQSYKKKTEIMKNQEIYDMWTNFINSDIYSKYFITNEKAWLVKFNEVIAYINQFKTTPSKENKEIYIKSLGQWISNQKKNYIKKSEIMSNHEIYKKWDVFINSETYNKYFITNEEIWNTKLNEVKVYINQNKIRPSKDSKDIKIKTLGIWISCQQTNYKKKIQIMSNPDIYAQWTEFINDPRYLEYFISNEDTWDIKLNKVKTYINQNKKRPSTTDKDIQIRTLSKWIGTQQLSYKKKSQIMSNPEIYAQWTEFINNKSYSKYFNNITNSDTETDSDSETNINTNTNTKISISNTDSDLGIVAKAKTKSPSTKTPSPDKIHPKSTTLKPKIDPVPNPTPNPNTSNDLINKKSTLTKSKYQELTKKMSTQKSQNTQKMFNDAPDLWEEYHAARDQSFRGYDKQEEIPVNKIISYLETKIKYRLKILDLGCGRNLIKQYFKLNTIFNITGYDYVENNGSKVCDISHLDEETDQIDICVYSQSLMGSNWKDYLIEGKRVLRYNGEMIISESVERFDIIREYLAELEMKIINADHNETKRWFYINAIKQ
jgi:hypothetical protein